MVTEVGLLEGEVCNRGGCQGIMKEVDDGSSCSCHINPPCGHCVDMLYYCPVCGAETEPPEPIKYESSPSVFSYKWETPQERFAKLPLGVFDYVTIPGKYYWMEYWGRYPDSMSAAEILAKFNTCFGYKWIKPPCNGEFHIKVYTD